jgi:hypothetical protein
MFLSIQDLVRLTHGQLKLAAMPHVDGAWVLVPRIVLDSRLVERGDLFWRVEPQACDAQLAFFRGAIGLVTDGRQVEPWPGTFCLQVRDAVDSLQRLVDALQTGQAAEIPERFLPAHDSTEAATEPDEESFSEWKELKILQLPARGGIANFPLTCGQVAKRCRRRAA